MEVEVVLDLSQKSISEKENDIPTPMDLSQKAVNATCLSEDEEDDVINALIASINTENPSPEAIGACQKLLRQLDEKLRNEETIEILLSQMKMTQRRGASLNGTSVVNRQNSELGSVKPSDGVAELLPRVHVESTDNHGHMNTGETSQSLSRPGTQTMSATSGAESVRSGAHMTREMALQALDQQYMARKALLRKQADKSLSEIPLVRPSQSALAQSDLNLVPSAASNEFVALLGLEEVVKNLQEYRTIAMGHKGTDMNAVFAPFACVQCASDFTPLWKRERPGSSSVVCESCCSHNYRKAVQKDYQEKIKLVLKKYQDQERDLDRDYKDMLDSPKKFELFRKEQEKKVATANGGARPSAVANSAHNSGVARSTTHSHQTATPSQAVRPPVPRAPNVVRQTSSAAVTAPTSAATTQQQYVHQPLRHQNNNTGQSNAAQSLSVDQMAYMQMFQALNQLGSSTAMNSQASRQQQQLMQQILQMAYMSSASSLLAGGGSSNNTSSVAAASAAAANPFMQLLNNMAGLVGTGNSSSGIDTTGANNTIMNYYMSILQQQASNNSDK